MSATRAKDKRAVSATAGRAPARVPTLSSRWAAAILAVLVVLFFHEVVIGGKTFVSPDTTAPAGFVRMGEQSLYHDHVYPLWNPYVFLGMPSFASGAYNPLIYPPDWPVAIVQKVLPFLPELTWMLLYYFLGGVFMFLLAREWGAKPEGALLGAVAFVFSPNLVAVGSHGHGSQLVNSMILPLMMWLATRWMRHGRLQDLGWLALAGGFQLLRGHVQICFYTWMAVGLYTVAELIAGAREGALPTRLARAAGVAAAAVLAFGIAGFYNLPLRDYAKYSIRGGTDSGGGVGMDYATSWSLAPYELPTLVVPGWTGFGGATYWGGMPFTDYPNAFVGVVTATLAVCAIYAQGWVRLFALALAALALMISFGRYFPLYGLLYDHLPLFNKFRIPVMIVILVQLAAALGLAWGWSAVLERASAKPETRRPMERALLGIGVALAAALLVGVLAQDVWRAGYVRAALEHRGGTGYTEEMAMAAYRGFVSDLGRACLYGLLTVAAAWFAVRSRRAGVASAMVLVLLLIELWPVSGKLMLPVIGDPVQRNADIGRDDVVEFFETVQKSGTSGPFRIFPIEEFQNNRFAGFGIASVGGYHAAKPRLIQDLIDPRRQLQADPAWMRLLNIRYIVTRQQLPDMPTFKLVHQGSANVYENLSVLPRATLVGQYRVVKPDTAIFDSVRVNDSAQITFLDRDPGLQLGPVEGGAAVVSSYRLNDVVVDVDTPGPALLRLADAWYPDWKVRVDGQPAELLRADYLLRAVPVPAGKHRVEFQFESRSVRTGLAVSIVSLLIVTGLLVAGWWLDRRRRVASHPAPAPAPATAAAV